LCGTKEEALAFVKGYEAAINLIDDDQTFVLYPVLTAAGEWRVDFNYHV